MDNFTNTLEMCGDIVDCDVVDVDDFDLASIRCKGFLDKIDFGTTRRTSNSISFLEQLVYDVTAEVAVGASDLCGWKRVSGLVMTDVGTTYKD